ncbi:MAG: VOC family protein [Hyphomicrobiaceae bacterium]
MSKFLSAVTVIVPDYDAAIAFYVGVLGFELCEDTHVSESKRWITVAPPGSGYQGCRLLLARAANCEQEALVGRQTGGRVFLFLRTDNFDRDYVTMKGAGIQFCEEPRDECYGRVAVFTDPFGNRWDLIEPN